MSDEPKIDILDLIDNAIGAVGVDAMRWTPPGSPLTLLATPWTNRGADDLYWTMWRRKSGQIDRLPYGHMAIFDEIQDWTGFARIEVAA